MQDRLGHALRQAAARNRIALLFLDLDKFKPVNEQLWPCSRRPAAAGGRRPAQAHGAEGDTVARVHGDEFVVISRESATPSRCRVAVKIVAALGNRS